MEHKIISLYYVPDMQLYHIRVLGEYGCDFPFRIFSLNEEEVDAVLESQFPEDKIIPYERFLELSRKMS